MLGSRGLRSHVAPARPVPPRPEPPPPPAIVPRAPPPARRPTPWMGPVIGVAAGWLISSALFGGFRPELEARGLGLLPYVLLGAAFVAFGVILRRHRAARTPPAHRVVHAPSVVPERPAEVATSDGSSLD